jgi:hypothetical protein
MIRNRTRQPKSEWPPRRRSVVSFLRRGRKRETALYREAAAVIQSRRSGDALAWISANLKPEAARMLETCLSTYGPNEALRWISYWEEKKEPIGKEPEAVAVSVSSLH